MATHFSILAWKIPWTEEPGVLLSMGSQKIMGHTRHLTPSFFSLSPHLCKRGRRLEQGSRKLGFPMLCQWQFFSPCKLKAITCTDSWEAWFLLYPWKQKQPCSLDLWEPYWHDGPRYGWSRCAQVERPPEPGSTRHNGNKIFHPQVVLVIKTPLANAGGIERVR